MVSSVLAKRDWLLIVSLPRNDEELARAAVEGGADCLKVHLNLKHRASQSSFGSFAEEEEKLNRIKGLGIPVGVVPGRIDTLDEREIEKICSFGFDFIDVYVHDCLLYLLNSGMPVVPAVHHDTPDCVVRYLRGLDAPAVEASIVHPEQYGQPLVLSDLLRYQHVSQIVERPLIIPTQKAISVEDLPQLARINVKAIMIGAVVTGTNPDSLYTATRRFRIAIDQLR